MVRWNTALVMMALIVAGRAATAGGQTWTETGDAAEFPAQCGQEADGSGSLLTISGSSATTSDDFVDAFVIEVVDPACFYATTSAAMDPAAAAGWNTRLFLFDLDGNPVLANDDAPGVEGAQSYLSGPAAFPGAVDPTAAPLAAGLYVLVVSGWANDALDENNIRLFDIGGEPEALFGPNPAADSFDRWRNLHGGVQSGSYTVALAGTAAVPDCPADVTCDRTVDIADLLQVILTWDQIGTSADIDQSGTVGVGDLVEVIVGWGPCL